MKRNTGFNNHWSHSISIFILCLFCNPVFAQKQLRVVADGVSVSRDMTPVEALEEALTDARKNALLKAGISEQLLVSNLLYAHGTKDDIETYFHSISNTELKANILIDSILNESNRFDQYGNMVITVEIEAMVYAYEQPRDPRFFFDLSQLREVYYENEYMSFSFTPAMDGFLTIFAFNEQESLLLYPFENQEYEYLSDTKERMFVKGETVTFPVNEAYAPGYSIELDEAETEEMSILLFVYTKKHVPWIDDNISLKSVRSWIYEIPMHEREVVYKNVLIKQLD